MEHCQRVNYFLEMIRVFRQRQILTQESSHCSNRYKVGRGSKPFDMEGLPLNDLMELDRYLINGVHLRIVLHRNSAEFCLIRDEDNDNGGYQVKLLDCYLRILKCKPNPAILVAHSTKGLTAKYPYIRTETKSAYIASGQSVFSWDHIKASYLPTLVRVCFADSAAVQGSLKLNRFNMEHVDVRQISLYVNGIPCSGCPINVNYNQVLTAEVFDRMYGFGKGRPLYTAMGGISGKDRGNVGINRADLSYRRANNY